MAWRRTLPLCGAVHGPLPAPCGSNDETARFAAKHANRCWGIAAQTISLLTPLIPFSRDTLTAASNRASGSCRAQAACSGTCINTRRPAAAADRTSINLATRRRLNSRPMTANRSKTALPPAHPIAYHLPSMRHFWSKVACPQRNSVQQPKTGTMAFEVLKFNWQVHTQPRRSNS